MGREEDTREKKYHACFLLASGIASRSLENHAVFSARNNIKGDVYRHENAASCGPSLDLINPAFNQNNDQTET